MSRDVLHLDLRGMRCPIPVRETRIALRELDNGAQLDVSADDPDALRDIPALIERMGMSLLEILEEAGEFRFSIHKSIPPNSPKHEGIP